MNQSKSLGSNLKMLDYFVKAQGCMEIKGSNKLKGIKISHWRVSKAKSNIFSSFTIKRKEPGVDILKNLKLSQH